MEIIEDLMNGEGFEHYKNRFLKDDDTSTMSDEDLMKIYHSRSEMKTVIKKFVSYCPNLSVFVPKEPLDKRKKSIKIKQKKIVEEFLKKIKWKSKLNQIFTDLETKGDVFYYMYFDSQSSKIPMFKPLNAKNMADVVLDSNGRPSVYKYIEYYAETDITETGEIITKYTGEVIYIFQKGKTTIYKQNFELDKDGEYLPVLKDGKNTYTPKVIPNRASYIDEIPIVRIKSYLRDGEKFSDIPASDYIEHQLTLDDSNSQIKYVNMMLGYPVNFIINGRVVRGEWKPGGFVYVDNIDPSSEGYNEQNKSEAKVQDLQIKNDLNSMFRFYVDEDDALRESAGLISKTLQLALGKSDSSRVIQQLIAPMVNKIELYVDNVCEGMELPIMVVLKENGLWDEDRDSGVTLFKPPFMTSVSVFDQQIYNQNEINIGTKTKTEIGLESGESYEEIEARETVENENVEANNESNSSVRSANNI